MIRVAIVGTGLVGGSLALALRARNVASDLVLVDESSVLAGAAVAALGGMAVPIDDRVRMAAAFGEVDLVVLAAPVSVIESEIVFSLEHAKAVTDCGSTKRAIVARAANSRRARFLPGHPLAGGSVAGAQHARADLFENRRWVLCPEATDPDVVELVEGMIRGIGASPVSMTASDHDRAVAITSHVPQVLSSLLVTLAERAPADTRGPAFEYATQSAGANPAVWRDIFASNGDEISVFLRELASELSELADSLSRDPPDTTRALAIVEAARKRRTQS